MKKFVKNVGFIVICTAIWTVITYVACKIHNWFDDYRANKEIEKLNKELEEAGDTF